MRIPFIKKFHFIWFQWKQNVEKQLISSCFESLESFLLQSETIGMSVVLIADENKGTHSTERSPVKEIAHILGIKNIGK